MQGTLNLVLYMAFFFGLMYFLIIRPQNKKNKQLNDLRANLKSGDEVVTIGGMAGKVRSVKDDEIVIEMGPTKTKLTFKKWAISAVENSAPAEPAAITSQETVAPLEEAMPETEEKE